MSDTAPFAPPPSLFLPLSEDVARALVAGESPDEFFDRASRAELAALMLLLNLKSLVAHATPVEKLERMLDDVMRAGQSMEEAGGRLADLVRARFNAGQLAEGLTALEMAGIGLLEDHEVEDRHYLDEERQWDFDFGRRQREKLEPLTREVQLPSGERVRLSDQQSRIFDEFRGCQDESFHLQAYAGVGKTFLLAQFFEVLDPRTTLLMATFPAQVAALRARVRQAGPDMPLNACTFGHMANLLLNRDLTSRGWRNTDMQRTGASSLVDDGQIAQWLNLPAVGPLHPRQVAWICRNTVHSYCLSPLAEISSRHLPSLGYSASPADIAVLLQCSRRLWDETVRPSAPHIRLPIRNSHRIKFLSLTSEVIPEDYHHIIIDESHELTAPMVQILDRSPQAVITLGDDFQQLSGRAPRHGGFIRQRFMTQSIRAGKQMAEVLDPLIQKHPSDTKEGFVGRAPYPTRIIGHGVMPIPDKPTTILVANEWGLFAWFRRLSEAGTGFQLPARTLEHLTLFVKGVDLLYHEDLRPQHRLIFRYAYWDALASAMGGSHEFKAIHEWLGQGNRLQDFLDTVQRVCVPSRTGIVLARVEDVKNQEFDAVLLSRDLMRPPREGSSHSLASVCSLLYTASSRARHELLLPGNMSDWLQDIGRP
ncbi:hypothetical protein ACIPL1_20530 [Pseudomonas sp. NPDC090202]|uniref:hypothetical protein n=1 Tax=unclassified Pseudomonas TaxID=196821 RepID=UPI0037F933E2